MELTPKQKEQLVKYLEVSKYEHGCYIFGPVLRKETPDLYEILTLMRIGHYAAYVDRTVINNDNAPVFVYVSHHQATKLLKAISETTGEPLPVDTKVEVEPKVKLSVIEPSKKLGQPKKDKVLGLKLNFDFSGMLKK
jgi:hypothetical protein